MKGFDEIIQNCRSHIVMIEHLKNQVFRQYCIKQGKIPPGRFKQVNTDAPRYVNLFYGNKLVGFNDDGWLFGIDPNGNGVFICPIDSTREAQEHIDSWLVMTR